MVEKTRPFSFDDFRFAWKQVDQKLTETVQYFECFDKPLSYKLRLIKLQKRISKTVAPSLAVSLEPLAHRRNVASLNPFYRYYFGRNSSGLAQLVPLTYSRGRSTRYSDRLQDFSVTISRCYKDVYVNNFFSCTTRLWYSLPIKCFPLTYDLSGFKSRINRHHLTVGSF